MTVRTVGAIARERGADTLRNEHMFQWVTEMLAADDVHVRADFPLGIAPDGSYTVTINARPKPE